MEEQEAGYSLVVSGCSTAQVAAKVDGVYKECGQNHGKPVCVKKADRKVGMSCIYFWDMHDWQEMCRWGLGQEIGDDAVCAHSSYYTSGALPPVSGWHDGLQ